jgi:hypothetical protein
MDIFELLQAWENVRDNLTTLTGGVIQDRKVEVLDVLRGRLMTGEDGTGDKIGDVRPYSKFYPDYADLKYQMNPLAGYRNPDLKLTGEFHNDYNLDVQGDAVVIGNSNDKTTQLVEWYSDSILELSDAGWEQAWGGFLQDDLVDIICDKTGATNVEL